MNASPEGLNASENPWSAVEDCFEHFRKDPSAGLEAMISAVKAAFLAPRDSQLVRAWIGEHMPPGCYLIYGAGSHSTDLLSALEARPDIVIAGFLDKDAAQRETFSGYPVFAPDEPLPQGVDRILLSHTCRTSDMAFTLTSAGVPKGMLLDIYRENSYVEAALKKWFPRLPVAETCDVVILRAGRSHVVEDDALMRAFGNFRVQGLFIGRADYREPCSAFPMLDLGQSLFLLEKALQRLKPRIVYLCSGWFNNFLGPVVASMAPQARLIHEMFDLNIIRPDGPLKELLGIEHFTHGWNLLGEFYSCQQAHMLVSKRDGDHWRRFAAGFKAPYLTYFTGARETTSSATAHAGSVRIVYGGLLPHPEFLSQFQSDYRFLELFEALAASGKVALSIFNALHTDASQDHLFKAYADKYQGAPLSYHGRLPYELFLERLKGFDYGWLASTERKDKDPDQDYVMPNRAVGYLAAGLPLIVDSGWSYVAKLVKEFNAGIVTDDFSTDKILALLHSGQLEAHRKGARALSGLLAQRNETLLKSLTALLADVSTSPIKRTD